jgi:ubiquitin carboxyl-terminal hydrolase L3
MATSWCPLESNPEVLASYVSSLGFPLEQYTLVDVLACEEWAFAMIPQPVVALLLLFPMTDNYEAAKARQKETLDSQQISERVFYLKQTIGNACGTIGLLHAIANIRISEVTQQPLQLRPESFLVSYFNKTAEMTPEQRGYELEHGEETAAVIEEAHEQAASEGQSVVVQTADAHFVAIVPVDGQIYELDGRKVAPVNFGPYSSPERFGIEAAEKVVRDWYIANDPEDLHFGIIAVVPCLA